MEMRVRATDPRPCPKCGKIYRSAHTLRTHLEDKHTVCPGYRCVLCGTVAKSRNSLHSHMSRQHRGISTKDLPVLPMPNPFDPELASRLLAKAGVKVSAAELRSRASPTSGTRRSDMKLEARGHGDDSNMDDTDDPEDLTMGGICGGNGNNALDGVINSGGMGNSNINNNILSGLSGVNNGNAGSVIANSINYQNMFLPNVRCKELLGDEHPNTTITRVRHNTNTTKNIDSQPTAAFLDTYLQLMQDTNSPFSKCIFHIIIICIS